MPCSRCGPKRWRLANCNPTQQQIVTNEMQGNQSAIEIQPANPEVVYVPYYDPVYIWGPPRYGYYPAWDYPGFGIGFRLGFGHGIYIGGFFGGLGWGGWGWRPNWFHCSINQNPYFFNHYGYGGGGFRVGDTWAHNRGHRLGVAYSIVRSFSTLRRSFIGSRPIRYGRSWRTILLLRNQGDGIILAGGMYRPECATQLSAPVQPIVEAADTARVRPPAATAT